MSSVLMNGKGKPHLIRMDAGKLKLLKTYFQNFVSEMIGTGILVFIGCMGVCKGMDSEGDKTGMVLTFGLAVFVAVQACCHVSGGHINPAVTILSLFFKKMTYPMALVYVCGQLLGGVAGFGLLKVVTPSSLLHANGSETHGLCTTVPNPNVSLVQATLMEFTLTSVLLLTVCSAWDPRNVHHDSMPLKFGFVVYSLAFAGLAYTGGSMNPARSFGPALWNKSWKDHWVYWVGPLSASLFCGFTYTMFFCPKIPSLKDQTLNARA